MVGYSRRVSLEKEKTLMSKITNPVDSLETSRLPHITEFARFQKLSISKFCLSTPRLFSISVVSLYDHVTNGFSSVNSTKPIGLDCFQNVLCLSCFHSLIKVEHLYKVLFQVPALRNGGFQSMLSVDYILILFNIVSALRNTPWVPEIN